MYLVNEYDLLTSEKYLELLDKVKNLNKKIYKICEPRYQFNLRNFNGELKTFTGKDLFFYEVISAENYCFKPVFYIKREVYNILQNLIKKNIKISLGTLKFLYFKNSNVIPYNNSTIYGKIDVSTKIEHCKLIAQFNNYIIEIPPVGISSNGIPFSENKIPDELQTSGWWIEGTAVKYFVNTFENKEPKNITLKLWYYKD